MYEREREKVKEGEYTYIVKFFELEAGIELHFIEFEPVELLQSSIELLSEILSLTGRFLQLLAFRLVPHLQ